MQLPPAYASRRVCASPELTGFRNYRLPAPRASGPSLPWNPNQRRVLSALDNFRSSRKFHHTTSTECSGFASSGALLTLWSPQVPAPLTQYHGAASQVVASYVSKTEGLVCSAIEAHEHTLQLLEALTKIFPPGEENFRVTQLLSGLVCTAYPTRDALYKQLGNLHILRRVSSPCCTQN